MSKDQSREERLAAQLRANLRKRKAQAKGIAAKDSGEPQAATTDAASTLPKSVSES